MENERGAGHSVVSYAGGAPREVESGGRGRGGARAALVPTHLLSVSTSCMNVLAHRCSPWSSTLGRSLSPCSRTGSPPPSAALHHVCMWRQTAGLCGRGRGLIASRDIVRGEPVFCEDVFVYAPRGDKFSQVLYVPTCLRHSVSHFENLCQEKVLTMGLATARDLQIWRCSCTHPPLSLTLTCRYKGVREQTLLSCTLGPVW